MSEVTLTITGIDEAMQALGLISTVAGPRALSRFAEEVKLLAIPYPPEGPWNTPGAYPKRWYQRHFGPRWARASSNTPGGVNTSERLQQQWVVNKRGPYTSAVVNRASYAGYVQGDEQTNVHKGHSWKRVDAIANEQQDLWERILREEIQIVMG